MFRLVIRCMIIWSLLTVHLVKGQSVTTVHFGTLHGSTTRTTWSGRPIYQFLGVRYAESPSGPRRFKVIFLVILNYKKVIYLRICEIISMWFIGTEISHTLAGWTLRSKSWNTMSEFKVYPKFNTTSNGLWSRRLPSLINLFGKCKC